MMPPSAKSVSNRNGLTLAGVHRRVQFPPRHGLDLVPSGRQG
jgi:hypothetical protein